MKKRSVPEKPAKGLTKEESEFLEMAMKEEEKPVPAQEEKRQRSKKPSEATSPEEAARLLKNRLEEIEEEYGK